jgi:hypothetical protein
MKCRSLKKFFSRAWHLRPSTKCVQLISLPALTYSKQCSDDERTLHKMRLSCSDRRNFVRACRFLLEAASVGVVLVALGVSSRMGFEATRCDPSLLQRLVWCAYESKLPSMPPEIRRFETSSCCIHVSDSCSTVLIAVLKEHVIRNVSGYWQHQTGFKTLSLCNWLRRRILNRKEHSVRSQRLERRSC